jgi:hypothetical protein
MTTLPPSPESAFDQDTANLKTLSIFWYILSALQALVGCVVAGYIVLVVMMGVGMASTGQPDDAKAGAAFGGFFGCIGLFILVIWWGLSLLNFIVARSLPRRRRRTLCFVMAVWVCFMAPLGTVLGIITLIVLSRPSVKVASI